MLFSHIVCFRFEIILLLLVFPGQILKNLKIFKFHSDYVNKMLIEISFISENLEIAKVNA